MINFREELSKIKAFAFDVDGVFSSDKAILYPSGEVVRTVNIKDGYIIQYAVKMGYPVAIISGGSSDAVEKRFRNLGVTDIYMKAAYKSECLEDFIAKYSLEEKDVLYMGDDIPDLEVLQKVGFPACPADAVTEVKSVCNYITSKKGGDGCVRELVEQVLKLQNKWMNPESLIW
jgi:3-deoxy-D-manno-octulosonate 8-phosphate phosphatase (KDO 8-P phosphatase)